MRTSGGVQVLVAVALLALSLSPIVMQAPGGPGVPAAGDDASSLESAAVGPTRRDRFFTGWRAGNTQTPTPTADQNVEIVATLKEDAEVSEELREKFGAVETAGGTRRISATVSLSSVREFSSLPSVQTVYVENRPDVEDNFVADGVETTGIADLQKRGMTGEGITVGVIGSGFRMTHPSVADQVRMYKMFSEPGPPVHGTAVASVVADVAPDSKLHFAAIGPRTDGEEYREAVQWLVSSGADVILDSGSYFGQPGDGTGPISRVASEVPDDVTFVTSAGNYAQRHWGGTVRAGGAGKVTFGDGQTKNRINGGRPVSGRITLALQWNGSADYDLHLYRETPAGDWLWASSETAGDSENISVSVRTGQYYVSVVRNGSAAETGPVEVSLFSNRRLQYRTPRGSLTAPATAPGVVAVGAVEDGEVAAFSSRGPTVGGGVGVDVVAPDDARLVGATVGEGTSFAAPYVAGTVALLRAEYPGLTSAEAVRAIEASAVDVGTAGVDPSTGHGLVDAVAAAARAEDLQNWPTQSDVAPAE